MSATPRDEYDVVIVGLGFAGAMAAISAHDEGARVAVLEKSEHFGGISILSGGGLTCGSDYELTLRYLERTCAEATPRDVLEAFARGMVEIPDRLARLAADIGFETKRRRTGGGYPFEGSDQIFSVQVTRNERYEGFPWLRGERAGATLFWVLAEHLRRRPAIDVFCGAPVRELVVTDGAVRGVVAEIAGGRTRVSARRGVVLASGGFEHNSELLRQYLPMTDVRAIGPLTHTGDGVLMAQQAGAALWHMWHVHGSYGFHVPGLRVAVRHSFDAFRDDTRRMAWIVVDRFGRRFMNEYPPAPQDTPIRALDYYDPDIQAFPRIPSFLLYDEGGRMLGPIGKSVASSDEAAFAWSDDNLREVEAGIVTRALTLRDLARALDLPVLALEATVARWNAACDARRDDDEFHRPAGTMVPLQTPPFYAIRAWPVVSNTQGGPVHDARQRVLDPFGRHIPHLYAAGELGSIFGHLYLLGGNLSECFIGGRIAGLAAAAEDPADA